MAWILGTTDKDSTEKAVHDNPFYSDVDIVWKEGNWTDKCSTVHHHNAKVFRGNQLLGYIYGGPTRFNPLLTYAFTPPEGDLPCDIHLSAPTSKYAVDKRVAGGVIGAVSLAILGFAAVAWWKKRKFTEEFSAEKEDERLAELQDMKTWINANKYDEDKGYLDIRGIIDYIDTRIGDRKARVKFSAPPPPRYRRGAGYAPTVKGWVGPIGGLEPDWADLQFRKRFDDMWYQAIITYDKDDKTWGLFIVTWERSGVETPVSQKDPFGPTKTIYRPGSRQRSMYDFQDRNFDVVYNEMKSWTPDNMSPVYREYAEMLEDPAIKDAISAVSAPQDTDTDYLSDIEDIRVRSRRIIDALSKEILNLPQNPDINIIKSKPLSFTLPLSETQDNWSPEYHDFKNQYEIIIEALSKSRIEEFHSLIERILQNQLKVKGKKVYFHPVVLNHFKGIIEN